MGRDPEGLSIGVREHVCAQTEAQEQLAIERVLALASDRISAVPNADPLQGLEEAMRALVDSLGYDRCTFSEFVAGDFLNVLCSSATDAYEALPRGRFQFHFPWFLSQLRLGQMVVMSNLPDDLPPEAVEEVQHCRASGLRSHLSIPVRIGGRVTSVLSFASVRQARQWRPETVARLKVLGELLGCVLALLRTEQEAGELRRRVWHADRVERVGALTAAIAHDLNQPLAAILSNAQAGLKYLAREDVKPHAIEEILQAVVREDKRAARTIQSMRSLMKKDQGNREYFDLGTTLTEIQRLLSSDFSAQGVRMEIDQAAPCPVLANRIQIEQLCLNLLLNAAAAVQCRSSLQRVIHVELSSSAMGRVALSVHDSGQGIAPENLQTIFDPFWSTREDGLGLGLAICRSIVESHGGRIWAESSGSGGATFRVELPGTVQRPDSPSPVADAAIQAVRFHLDMPGEAALVCVVDDDPAVRASLVRLLWHAGFEAHAFESADEFLASRLERDVACILLDMHMPGTPARQLQQQLTSKGDSAAVIFITGHADVAAGVEAIKSGAEDFLEKPVDADVLLAAVSKAVERFGTRIRQSRLQSNWKERAGLLSAREREVMGHVVRGRLNKQIAADLSITEQTVKQHRGRVMEKMGVRSIAELVRICDAAGFTTTR